MQNYYEILGISRDASPEQIKAAYRKLAKKYHPDASGSQENNERFQEIQEAYAVLSDPEKRRTYHYYGHSAYRKAYHSQHFTGSARHEHTHSHEHSDCDQCDGSCDGSCSSCKKKQTSRDPYAGFHVVRIAVWLEMEETFQEVVKDVVYKERIPNPTASRPAFVEKEWKFQVKIPTDTHAGQLFPLENIIHGDDTILHHFHDTCPDNRYVVILLLRDKPGYTRQDYHLCTDYTIDFHTLVLGGKVVIPTLTGDFVLDIPAGTSPEQRIRIPGQGLNYPKKIGIRGDLYLNLHVRIPRELNAGQLRAVQALREVLEAENAAV